MVRAGEEADFMHEEDMTKGRADALGLAAESADRSIMHQYFVPGGYYP
jgi:hypothetical protein